MKTLLELSDYKKYASHYVLATKSKTNAEAFFNQVKRSTPFGWKCVLYKLSSGYVIEYLSGGYIKDVSYLKTYSKII